MLINLFRRSPRISQIIAEYKASAAFARLAPETKKGRRWRLAKIEALFGHLPAHKLTRRHVDLMMSSLFETPGLANSLLSLLRVLLRPSVDEGMIERDVTMTISLFKLGRVHTWNEAEIAQFETRWPRGSEEALVYRAIKGHRGARKISGAMIRAAFDLWLWTDQRRTDVARIGYADIYGGRVFVKQSKTGTELSLPLHSELARAIAAIPPGNGNVLRTPTGRSFTPAELSYAMAAAIKAAGLPKRCVPHGLRKATQRRIAEKGGSAHHLKSVSGHKSLKEVATYTDAVDQQRLSDEAFKLITNRAEKSDEP